MYEYIFDSKFATLLAALVSAWLAGALVGYPRVALRLIAFNYGPAFACAFFMVGIAYGGQVSGFDLAAGLIFEFAVTIAFTKLFCDALKLNTCVDDHSIEIWLRRSLVLQLFLAVPLLTSEGFGIFSEGSRIAYLDNSAAAKYLTYAGVLISPIQAGLIARRLSSNRALGATGYAILVSTFVVSTLSGSKGGFFLWLSSIIAMVDFGGLRIRWVMVFWSLVAAATMFAITASIVSDTLGISVGDFIELVSARFLLSNDARALALDLGGSSGSLSELLASSLRSLSSLFGHPSSDPPLGLLLYEQEFGVSTGNGANASLIALITYYSTRGYAMFPTLIACLGLAGVYGLVVALRRVVRGHLRKMAVSLMGLTLIQQMSQDFLAFQLLIPLACAAGFFLLATQRKHAGASSRRFRSPASFTPPQHHHSGS